MMSQFGLFDFSDRLVALSAFGDPLERLSQVVNFEIFRPSLESGFNFSDGSQGGRPPYDGVLIFKVLILQSLYNLSDDQTEYQIKDRLSFMRFLSLNLCQSVPDAKTIWLYRERLKKKGLMDHLFGLFDQALREKGYLAMGGQIVDASIIQTPRQRMTKEEKAHVKAGEIPQIWKDNPAKRAQKDRDARWIVKYSKAKGENKAIDLAIPLFGYKNHLSIDRGFGFIRKYHVTDASLYDGKVLPYLLDKNNTSCSVWGDTARNPKSALVLSMCLLFKKNAWDSLSRPLVWTERGLRSPLLTLRIIFKGLSFGKNDAQSHNKSLYHPRKCLKKRKKEQISPQKTPRNLVERHSPAHLVIDDQQRKQKITLIRGLHLYRSICYRADQLNPQHPIFSIK